MANKDLNENFSFVKCDQTCDKDSLFSRENRSDIFSRLIFYFFTFEWYFAFDQTVNTIKGFLHKIQCTFLLLLSEVKSIDKIRSLFDANENRTERKFLLFKIYMQKMIFFLLARILLIERCRWLILRFFVYLMQWRISSFLRQEIKLSFIILLSIKRKIFPLH